MRSLRGNVAPEHAGDLHHLLRGRHHHARRQLRLAAAATASAEGPIVLQPGSVDAQHELVECSRGDCCWRTSDASSACSATASRSRKSRLKVAESCVAAGAPPAKTHGWEMYDARQIRRVGEKASKTHRGRGQYLEVISNSHSLQKVGSGLVLLTPRAPAAPPRCSICH